MNTCEHVFHVTKNLNPLLYPNGIEVTCGKCLSCKSAKKKEWSLRVWHEAQYYPDERWFLTLTYDEEHLPRVEHEGEWYATLRYHDVQKFIKLVRRHYEREFGRSPSHHVKYICTSELGENTARSHYHMILFGVPLSAKEYLQRYWPHGHIEFDYVNWRNIRYTMQYIDDVTYDQEFRSLLSNIGIEQPGKRQSQGLGKRYALANARSIQLNGLRTPDGHPSTIPRYYLAKLGLLEDLEFKAQMHDRANRHMEELMQYYGDHTLNVDDYLTAKYGYGRTLDGRLYMAQNSMLAAYAEQNIKKYKQQVNRLIRSKKNRQTTHYRFVPLLVDTENGNPITRHRLP